MSIDYRKDEVCDTCRASDQGCCSLVYRGKCDRLGRRIGVSTSSLPPNKVVPPVTVVVPPPPHQGERWQVPDYPQPLPIKEATIEMVEYTISMIMREYVGGKWEWTNVPRPKSIAVTAMENSNSYDVIRQGLEEFGYSFTIIQPINHRALCFMEAINGGKSFLMNGDYKNTQNCFDLLQASALGDENTHRCWFVTVRC